ncbi:A/G-specific adenine glycosylase [Salinisphaera sp. USBA-960]|nr:A/G-specific adenine glycosylase [Salifodinibacter halophilus]NNC26915.1 A/G-specific adenine glycosylase [Salifodinibacter halophilus]
MTQPAAQTISPSTEPPVAIDAALLRWFDRHGRHDLPWQHPRTAYRVWIAEIMLQQTQVTTVIGYFNAFLARFPDVEALAAADVDAVMHAWSGLGYYARARNMHAAAGRIIERHGGELPRDFDALLELPGIGQSTAGAIVAQVWGDWAPILDGNAKRVLARLAAIEDTPGTSRYDNRLWQLARAYTPEKRITDYTQAIMDLGATVCVRRNPRCDVCPLADGCQALAHGVQNAIPAPRKKRRKPVRTTHMALIVNEAGHILFEKRPPAGIWGGLWSLPEIPEASDVAAFCRQQLGIESSVDARLPAFRHVFTHFELDIHIIKLQATRATRIMEADMDWFDTAELPGVPAPIKRVVTDRQYEYEL